MRLQYPWQLAQRGLLKPAAGYDSTPHHSVHGLATLIHYTEGNIYFFAAQVNPVLESSLLALFPLEHRGQVTLPP